MELVDGNRITLLHNGAEYFPALIAACDAATREIHLETYIFEGDRTGQRGRGGARAGGPARGLDLPAAGRLRIASTSTRSWSQEMRGAGVNLLVYRPNISAVEVSALAAAAACIASWPWSMRGSRSSAGSTS